MWSLLLSPGSWCAQGFVCALQESVSPVLWKFCNQILLAFKVKFSGDSQSLCWIPRLGNLLWALVLSQQCGNFFGIIVLQFVGCLPGRLVGFTCCASRVCWSQSPCSHGRPLLTCASAGDTQTLKGKSDSVSVRSPGVQKFLFELSQRLWQVWGLILNAIFPLLSSCWGFSFALGHGVSFFGGI